MRIGVIDYGMGNLYSVEQAIKRLGAEVVVTNDMAELEAADALVLPGVGAFPDAMERLTEVGLTDYVCETKKPLLGICLGMQLMFESSEEVRETKGLGIFKGHIEKFKNVSRIPHMGWNDLQFTNGEQQEKAFVYFVHSFLAVNINQDELVAYADYEGVKVPAVVAKANFTGMQFHPEKSGEFGILLLKQWMEKAGQSKC